MERKDFLKQLGAGSIVALSSATLLTACKRDKTDPNACADSPTETAGPFPIKTPADLVRENIVGNRTGVPLLITFKIQNVNADCTPLSNVLVDLWHCDAGGNYSEYSGQQDGDFTSEQFLRGRQTTNANGEASFISIYPGWYPGRAPHLHAEVLTLNGSSLLVTQVAFPEDVSNTVYATSGYNGNFDTKNKRDDIFRDSLSSNLADSVSGNTTDGYTMVKTIKVSA